MVLSSENVEYFHLSAPLDEIIFDSKVSKSVFIVMFAVQISIEVGQTVANIYYRYPKYRRWNVLLYSEKSLSVSRILSSACQT